jgi:hypothetical protein
MINFLVIINHNYLDILEVLVLNGYSINNVWVLFAAPIGVAYKFMLFPIVEIFMIPIQLFRGDDIYSGILLSAWSSLINTSKEVFIVNMNYFKFWWYGQTYEPFGFTSVLYDLSEEDEEIVSGDTTPTNRNLSSEIISEGVLDTESNAWAIRGEFLDSPTKDHYFKSPVSSISDKESIDNQSEQLYAIFHDMTKDNEDRSPRDHWIFVNNYWLTNPIFRSGLAIISSLIIKASCKAIAVKVGWI